MAVSTFKGVKSALKKYSNAAIAEYLMKKGKEIVEHASEIAQFENDTYNLRASYACAVYYNGKEYTGNGKEIFGAGGSNEEVSRYYRSINPDEPRKVDGQYVYAFDLLDQYFDQYKAPLRKWQLVIVVAMPYASFLPAKYRVLGNIGMELNNAGAPLQGRVMDAPHRYDHKWW